MSVVRRLVRSSLARVVAHVPIAGESVARVVRGERSSSTPPPSPESAVMLREDEQPVANDAALETPPRKAPLDPGWPPPSFDKIVGEKSFPAQHIVTYDWDYGTKRQELRTLYEKSKDLNWNARTDLPWKTNVDPESELVPDMFNPIYGTDIWKKLDPKREVPKLRRHIASYLFSNFLHGEQGALLATAQLVEAAPTTDAKMYAAAQVFDEARHVEAYNRYLTEKVELVYPPNPHLKQLLDAVLSDSRWDMKLLGMQILIEGLALGAFGLIHQTANEPLIKKLTQMIMQDEARHVAFGVMSLKGLYADMSEAELREREDFVLEGCRLLRDRFLGQEVWETVGLPVKACEEAAKDSMMMQMFRKLLFSKIVPNVKRLGLLTPRVRRGFEDLQVIEYESWAPSA